MARRRRKPRQAMVETVSRGIATRAPGKWPRWLGLGCLGFITYCVLSCATLGILWWWITDILF